MRNLPTHGLRKHLQHHGLWRSSGRPRVRRERPLPDSNRGWRICNPLPYRLAKGPNENLIAALPAGVKATPAGSPVCVFYNKMGETKEPRPLPESSARMFDARIRTGLDVLAAQD